MRKSKANQTVQGLYNILSLSNISKCSTFRHQGRVVQIPIKLTQG